MKKKLLTLLLMIGLMVMIIPFSADAAGDSFDTATEMTSGETYGAGFSSNHTSAYFKITMKKSGKLSLKMNANFSGTCYVYASDKTKNLSEVVDAGDETTFTNYLRAGLYYVKFYNNGKNNYKTLKLEPTVTYVTESFPENAGTKDDNKGKAHSIKANKEYKGVVGFNDAKDYFKINVTKKTILRFETVKTGYKFINFEVQDSSGKLKKTVYADTSYNGKYVCLPKGTYYIVANCSTYQTGTYSFKVSATPVGWNQDSKGWWYMDEYGSYLADGKKKIGSKYYFFSKGGYMQTGWKQISGDWYYFKSSGEMATGWAQIGKQWYYFQPSLGYMMTGYRQIGNYNYYLASDGHMMTGWTKVYGYQHYFNSDGTEAHGWKKIGGYWYYFRASGIMCYGGRYTIDGRNYNFNSNGVCLNP